MKQARTLQAILVLLVLSAGTVAAVATPSEVWVDHSWTGPGDCGGHTWGYDAFATIGEGVDAVDEGGAVYVSAGAYNEQVVIETNDIRLIGLGTLDLPTKIEAPGTWTHRFFSGPTPTWPILSVEGATGVSIANITVDGLNRPEGIGRFVGIAFWNADGQVRECRVTAMSHLPRNEQSSGIGIYSGNDGGGPYELSLIQTTVDHYQAGGYYLTGHNVSYILNGCTALGSGRIEEIGQTGIEIADGPSATITDCHVSGHEYIGRDGLVGTGYRIDNAGGPVDINCGCTSVDDQVGVLFQDTSGSIREMVISNAGDSWGGIIVHNTTIPRSGWHGNRMMGENPQEIQPRPMQVTISGCDIGGHGITGLSVLTDGSPLEAEISGNRIHNWENGIIVDGAASPVVHVYGNRFYENTYAHAVDNGAAPPSRWSLTATSGPGNYWDNYGGTGAYAIPGKAGAIDQGPNPSVSFSIQSGSSLINCSGRATLTATMSPVACMRSYDLLFEYDATKWNNPTFTNLLPLEDLGEVEASFTAFAVGTGKWRIMHTIVGHTSGFASAVPVEICRISLAPKTAAQLGSSSFSLGTRYASIDYPMVYDTFNEEIESTAGTQRPGVSVDCTAPLVTSVTAYGQTRSGEIPQVIVGGSEGPASGGRVTKLWYQFRPQGQSCSNGATSWKELADVSLPWGNWVAENAYKASATPAFVGGCTMYVMAEDAAGNKGNCAGSAKIDFYYDPNLVVDDGTRGSTDGTVPPGHYGMGSIAPNPFESRTTIPFALPVSSHVRLVIYDVSGRLVRTLVDEVRSAGYDAAEWDGSDDAGRILPRGIYFCRLDAGTYHSQKRMLFLN